MKYKYLYEINSPEDLRQIPLAEMPRVCDEVRHYMIDVISKVGGHFGSGLGAVELTVALHYVYDTPTDKVVFDVGHQGYPHKILTGRRDQLHTIRQSGGISGFLKTKESPYDAFGAGHASTSISAALGLATARDIQKKDFRVVSLIGDGAMTGGMAFEAMNNCGVQNRNITVVLNDNDISIAKNVSALSNYFNDLYASTTVRRIRDNIWDITGKLDSLGDRLRSLAGRLEDGVKAIITPGVLFEAFGFNYFGPIDGNNVIKLIRMFQQIKDMSGPIFLHTITMKGKGYGPAEKDNNRLHAIGKINKETGKSLPAPPGSSNAPKYSKVFGQAMIELCETNPDIVAITAAMPGGTGLAEFSEKYPDRFFDVGIAEGHAVTFAAGLAMQGIVPVAAIYSTFLQRAFDQVIHDCALQKLHVVFALDRAGLVGGDGPTHHGVLDLAYLRSIQNFVVMAPKDEQELRDMLYTATNIYKDGPIAVRYPRGKGLGVPSGRMNEIPIGKGEIVREGEDIAILAIGKMVGEALFAADILEEEGISAEVANARFVKPLDGELIEDLCTRFSKIITVEDGQVQNGFGSAVLEYMNDNNITGPEIIRHGIPDKFIEHGEQRELLHSLQLDGPGIASKVKTALNIPETVKSEIYIGK